MLGCATQAEIDQEKTDYLKMGDLYFEKGDYARAYDWYSEGVPLIVSNTADRSSSVDTDFYNQSRYTFETVQDPTKKDSVIKISIDSKGEECFYKAMDCLVKLGKYGAVISRYEKYLQVFPNYSGIDQVISNIKFIIDEYTREHETAAVMRAQKLLITIDAFSKDGKNAHFVLADYHFRNEDYEYAIYYYDDILAYFPRDKQIPFVYYRLGICYFNDFRGIYYDYDPVLKSEKYFKKFIEAAPDHPERKKAEAYLAEIADKKAAKVLFKAKFYMRRNDFKAAGSYLREIREDFGKTRYAAEAEALLAGIADTDTKDD